MHNPTLSLRLEVELFEQWNPGPSFITCKPQSAESAARNSGTNTAVFRGTLWRFFFRKKVSQCRTKLKADPVVSPGTVCYAVEQEKPFWFNSLGELVQFDTPYYFVELLNYFGLFVWIEKKVIIIVAFHFMKRRLKSWVERVDRNLQSERIHVSR